MNRLLAAVFLCSVLAACSQATAPSAPSAPAAESQPPAKPGLTSSAPDLQAGGDALFHLKPAMRYADARKALLEHGWKPLRDDDCLANVIGSNFKSICTADNAMCRVCDELPELSAYSGDAHALSRFQDDRGRTLMLTSVGEIRTWNSPPPEADLQILSWEVTSTDAR